MAATWAMNSLGASPLLLSLMSSAAAFPFFLFTLPAGAVGDLADRRTLLVVCNCLLASTAALMACFAFAGGLTKEVILAGVFLLGAAFAFQAPVASASIPEIVGKEQLPSAIALGGIQMNVGGIIGPAIGGFLIPLVGTGAVFALNAVAFVLVLLAVFAWKRKRVVVDAPLESFLDSLTGAVRYMQYAPGVRIVLVRNLIFGVLIGAIPALLPVVGLKVLHLSAVDLGLVFACMGFGSLAGAVLLLEPARKRLKPNQMTILAGGILAVAYALMATVRHPRILFIVAAVAGAAWTVSASELWIAGQRVIPDWIRGRMNATHMMASQGGMALAGLLWGTLATKINVEWTLFSASVLGIVSALTARRWSIDFSAEINLESDPFPAEHDGLYLPEPNDGPITVAHEVEVAPENHIRFFRLMQQARQIFLRNGAISTRLDQDMENPNRFRLHAIFSSWAAVQRLEQRITRDERSLWSQVWTLTVGGTPSRPKRYLTIQHWMDQEFAISRLKLPPEPP
jgi:MFS family permease